MNSYIILSAGIGRNTKGEGNKSLFSISRTDRLIDRQIKNILSNDKTADIILVGGFEYDKVISYLIGKSYNIRTVCNYQYLVTSQSESLKIGINAAKESNVTVIHGDISFSPESIKFSDKKRAWINISDNMKSSSVGTVIQDGVVRNMSFGLDNKWGQIFFLPKSKFLEIKKKVNTVRTNRMTYEIINSLNIDLYPHFDDSKEIGKNQ